MLPQSSAMDEMLQLLTSDANFAASVAAANAPAAAVSALLFLKSQWKSVAAALKLPSSYYLGSLPLEGDSPSHRRSSDGGGAWRGQDTAPREFRKGDRVVVIGSNKRYTLPAHLLGKEGVVLAVRQGGWLKIAVGSETVELQQRYVQYVPRDGLPGRGGYSRGSGGGGGLDRSMSLGRGGGLRGAGVGRKDLVKGMRKELAALEEQVPWSKVQDRWRAARRSWVRRLKTVEQLRDLAQLIRELADAVKVDRSSGLFVPGGPWEVALREVLTGQGTPSSLSTLWHDMKAALGEWLSADQLPGTSGGFDRATQRRALATAQVLLEAAAAGGDALEQVPLELILSSQREVMALQAVIQQQMAAAQAQLAAAEAAGTTAAAAEAAAGAAANVAGMLKVEGFTEGLPAAAAEDGTLLDQDMDTDQGEGPDATDLEGAEWY